MASVINLRRTEISIILDNKISTSSSPERACNARFVSFGLKLSCGGQQELAADPQSGLLAATVVNLTRDCLSQKAAVLQLCLFEERISETAINNVWRGSLLRNLILLHNIAMITERSGNAERDAYARQSSHRGE